MSLEDVSDDSCGSDSFGYRKQAQSEYCWDGSDDSCGSDSSGYRKQAASEYCWDGPWSYTGLSGMMVGLARQEFMEFEYDDFLDEKESNPSLDEEEEFVSLDFHRESDEDFARLHQWLSQRKLDITDGLVRRHFEGLAPIRIRIRRLDEEIEVKPMMKLKQRGNEMFGKKKYEDAIDLYDEALMGADDMYIGPSDQIKLIATILSNRAECELQLGMYDDAGNTATNALIFMNQEKSRIRRAKAGMAVAAQKDRPALRLCYLAHAQRDLEDVLDPENNHTSVAKETCRKLLSEIENEVGCTKISLLEEHPELDFDEAVRMYRSNHW